MSIHNNMNFEMAFNNHVSTLDTPEISEKNNYFSNLFENIKITLRDIIDDIKNKKYDSFPSFLNIFIKNNRILYFGLFLIFICIILYILSFLFYSKKKKNPSIDVNTNINLSKKNIDLEDIYNKINNLGDKIKLNNLTMDLLNKNK